MMMDLRALFAILLFLFSAGAAAHKPSDSYLSLRIDQASVAGQWDIALRDLDYVLGLDADQDGAITWGEVRTRHADIAAYRRGKQICQRLLSPVSRYFNELAKER